LATEEAIQMCPTVYQEVVWGHRHVRASCFGDEVHSVLIESAVFDWRRDLSVPFRPYALGADTEAALVALLRSLDLRMGVMDLRSLTMARSCGWRFNPQGQFLFSQAESNADLNPGARSTTMPRGARSVADRGSAGLAAGLEALHSPGRGGGFELGRFYSTCSREEHA
jgi:hypothetical protein